MNIYGSLGDFTAVIYAVIDDCKDLTKLLKLLEIKINKIWTINLLQLLWFVSSAMGSFV